MHDVETEQAVIGAVLLENGIYDDVAAVIDEHDFYDPVHARIWQVIRDKVSTGALASPVTIRQHLTDELSQLGGPEYLMRMVGAVVSIKATHQYVLVLKDLSQRRAAIEAMQEAKARITAMEAMPEVLSGLEGSLTASEDKGPSDSVTLGEAMTAAAERMNQAFTGDTPPGISLGIAEVSATMGNLLPGDVLLIGARPSMGKSALAIDIGKRVAKAGVGCVYWCGEMLPEDNAERLMSSEAAAAGTKVSYHLARQGRMREEQFKALLESARDMQDLPLMLVNPSIKRLDRLCHAIRRNVKKLRQRNEKCIVIVDYIQQITVNKSSRFEVVTEVSQQLKALAVELRVPMIVLSQLSRKVEERDDKRPRLSDLRESGQLEQDANVIWFLFREDYYLEREIPSMSDEGKMSAAIARLEDIKGQLDIITAKQRSGPLSTVVLAFDGATNSINSLNHEDGSEAFI